MSSFEMPTSGNLFAKACRLIDWKVGAISGVLMGVMVFFINIMAGTPADYLSSSEAGVKQAVYTLFVGGFLQQISNWFAVRPGSSFIAISLAALVPGLIASSLVYFIHAQSGTPHPFLSTLPVIVLALTFFPILAIIRRKSQKFNALER